MIERRLDFFVIGAQKCATSWLFYCLREHPGLSLPKKKTEAHYLGGPEVDRLGLDWFFGQYGEDEGKPRGSVSVDYLHDERALRRILQEYPRAKFIVSLRHPFERSVSAYQWLSRKGLIPPDDLETGLARGIEEFVAGATSSGREELITRSLYGRQLAPIFEMGRQDDLLVIGYEHLCMDPSQTLRAVYDFLGVDPTFVPDSFAKRPKRNANWPVLTRLERLAPQSRVMGKFMDHANQIICRLGLDRPKTRVDAGLETRFREVLQDDMRSLARNLSRLPRAQVLGNPAMPSQWGFAKA